MSDEFQMVYFLPLTTVKFIRKVTRMMFLALDRTVSLYSARSAENIFLLA
jgi:hypothetical protein